MAGAQTRSSAALLQCFVQIDPRQLHGRRKPESLYGSLKSWAFLQRQGAIVETAPADFEAQVRDGKLDLALSVPEDYGKEFEAGRSAPVQLFEDSSRTKSRSTPSRSSGRSGEDPTSAGWTVTGRRFA